MSELAAYTVIGLGLGAIFALAALGIVLIYRATGVLNFAHGAMGCPDPATYAARRHGCAGKPWAALRRLPPVLRRLPARSASFRPTPPATTSPSSTP